MRLKSLVFWLLGLLLTPKSAGQEVDTVSRVSV